MYVVVVHNKKADEGLHDHRRLPELIQARGHDLGWYSIDDPIWRDAVRRSDPPVDLVAVAGGDGTFEAVVRVMAGSRTPLTVLPFGTANNISKAFGMADVAIDTLVGGWSEAVVRPMDIGVARGPWGTTRFVESVGVGLLADGIAAIDRDDTCQVNRIEDPETRLTMATDILRRMLRAIEARTYHLALDGRPLPGRYLLVEAFNLGLAGPNLQFAPHADLSDGLFDVVLVHEHLRRRLMSGLSMYRLDPGAAPALPSWKARYVTLSRGYSLVHIDDQVCGAECGEENGNDIELTVEPGAVQFLIPRIS